MEPSVPHDRQSPAGRAHEAKLTEPMVLMAVEHSPSTPVDTGDMSGTQA